MAVTIGATHVFGVMDNPRGIHGIPPKCKHRISMTPKSFAVCSLMWPDGKFTHHHIKTVDGEWVMQEHAIKLKTKFK